MSTKRIALQGRTSRRPVPIEIEAFAAGGGGQPQPFEPGIAAAVGDDDGRSRRHVLNVGHEAAGADDPAAMQIFHGQRRRRLVVPRRNVQRLALVDAGGAMRRVGRAEAMIERGLQRGGIVAHAVAGGRETAVLCANRLEIGEKEHGRRHHHAAVVSAVQVVLPSVLI
jgi:hypothetical protein